MYTPPTRRDSTVSSRRRQRCVLGFTESLHSLIAFSMLLVLLLIVSRVSCDNCQELKLAREPGEKLGMSVQGGVGSRCGNPFDSTDEGIFVSQVVFIKHFIEKGFYARQHICYSAYMPSPVRLSVRLSVCLSHGWISRKRLNLGSCNFPIQ